MVLARAQLKFTATGITLNYQKNAKTLADAVGVESLKLVLGKLTPTSKFSSIIEIDKQSPLLWKTR